MKIEAKIKENPKLCQRKLNDGRISLYLEYYLGREETPVLDDNGEAVLYETGAMAGKQKYIIKHHRRKEVLKLYLVEKPKTPAERQINKETIELAQRIRFEREQKFMSDRYGYRLKKDKAVDLYQYFESYIRNHPKKDKKIKDLALRDFRKYIAGSEYCTYSETLLLEQLTPDMVKGYTEYLQQHHRGGGARSIYQRFKTMVHYALDNDLLKKDVCKGISIMADTNTLKKDILTPEEIKKLLSTHYKRESRLIHNAFIFSLYCGLRFCDVKEITYGNIDYAAKRLTFEQAKTEGRSSASAVVIPLSDSIIKLIGSGERTQKIFPLPTYQTCYRALNVWVKHAGIEKHITWHCARHSFALNILNGGANIKTVSNLLGHSSIKTTERYVRAVDKLKEDAIKSLGEFADLE